MNQKLIAKKKKRIAQIDSSLELLKYVSKAPIEDANFFTEMSIGLDALSPVFLPAGIPAIGVIETFEALTDFDKDTSIAKKVATIALCCVATAPIAATSLALAAVPAAVIIPPLAVYSAISSAHIATNNSRIIKAQRKIDKLESEKARLLKEIKALESENERDN